MGLESLSEGMKNPISEYNDAFIQLQPHHKMKPVILGSLAAATNTKISTTHSNARPTVIAQTLSETAQGLKFITHVPSPATEPDGGGMCDKAHIEVENIVGYLDDEESGVWDSEMMVMVSTAANVDLNMDGVEIEDEVINKEWGWGGWVIKPVTLYVDYMNFSRSDFLWGDSLKMQLSLPAASDKEKQSLKEVAGCKTMHMAVKEI